MFSFCRVLSDSSWSREICSIEFSVILSGPANAAWRISKPPRAVSFSGRTTGAPWSHTISAGRTVHHQRCLFACGHAVVCVREARPVAVPEAGVLLVVAARCFTWRVRTSEGHAGPALWSFMICTAHGPGLMLVPASTPAPACFKTSGRSRLQRRVEVTPGRLRSRRCQERRTSFMEARGYCTATYPLCSL